MKKKIVIMSADDWQGLYIDGKLKLENHRLDLYDVLEVLGIDFDSGTVDEKWMEKVGHFPKSLSKVVEEKFKLQ